MQHSIQLLVDKSSNGLGGDALEKAHKVDTVLFDKTGTLTMGKPTVVAERLFRDRMSLKQFYLMVAAAEQQTDHPLSLALMNRAAQVVTGSTPEAGVKMKDWVPLRTNEEMRPGRGVLCWIEARALSELPHYVSSSTEGRVRIAVGNRQMMIEENIVIPAEVSQIRAI